VAEEITIDPVTRIEGHAKITIRLDDTGRVDDARFNVTQFRGFERIVQGRPVHEMPSIMARICGICPVSHLVASAKACDEILAVDPPPAGADLRRVMNLAQVVQSHALSFFHLSAPDLLFGFDADPAGRNVLGIVGANPQLARDGIALRRFGQHVIEQLGGKRIHPAWVVPGGVDAPLSADTREAILAAIPDALDRTLRTLDWYTGSVERWAGEAAVFGDFPSAFMALVGPDGEAEHYDGRLRVIDPAGHRLADDLNPRPYGTYIGEAVEPWSYLKSAYWHELGYPDGVYRVGPLARINVADRMGTPLADEALAAFRAQLGRVPTSSFHYHQARLIDVLHCLEKLTELLRNPDILSPHVRAYAGINACEGVGVAEAPRGTLFPHYRVDENGLVEWVNLLIATGHNNLAMNKSVLEVARHYVRGDRLAEPMLNRVEAVIRCYDPCLSCSTHAIGQMPMHVQLLGPTGAVLDELHR